MVSLSGSMSCAASPMELEYALESCAITPETHEQLIMRIDGIFQNIRSLLLLWLREAFGRSTRSHTQILVNLHYSRRLP